ncbi:hypothetical protein E0Z10_g9068 [Xylaria hypoxylon]|uniref:Uncharacterized protein n=1 Tax=Xylaria hypoxylon TaxID=37992 RepID=A0A4Z0Y9Q7_9PEZI|nr:hypothetical protein E0Z10_g9068 [Xylaria hypoxylon]
MTNMLKRQVFNTTSEYLQLPPEEDEPQRIHIGYKLGSIDLTNTIDSIGGEPSSGCMIGTEHAYPEATLSYKGLGTMLYSVQIIRSDKTFEEGATTWPQTKVTATECALQFCVNAYNTVVDNGRLSESVTASWSTLDPASYQPYGISEDEIVYWNNQGRDTFIYAPDYLRTDLEIFIPEDDRANYNISGDRRFGLTQNAIQELGQAFHDHAEWQNHFEYPQTVGTKANREEILYRSENLTATFQSVAESITSFLRDNSNLTQDGLAQEWSIYAQVNWPLLMAPLLTNLLGLLFCALCMLQTRNLKLDPWKTDMIATLAHSLDMKTRDQLRDASLRGSLSKMAGDVNVRFVDGVDGLEMRKAD